MKKEKTSLNSVEILTSLVIQLNKVESQMDLVF